MTNDDADHSDYIDREDEQSLVDSLDIFGGDSDPFADPVTAPAAPVEPPLDCPFDTVAPNAAELHALAAQAASPAVILAQPAPPELSTVNSPRISPAGTTTGPGFQLRVLHPAVVQRCNDIYFRQSMLKDYLTCPQMTLYRWVLMIEESEPFFAGILGSAGHEVIYNLHKARKFDYTAQELLQQFCDAFAILEKKQAVLPNVPAGHDSIQEAMQAKAPLYASMLKGYQESERNSSFYSTMHEQDFVLEVLTADGRPIYFTGTIDQAGYYPDGTFVLRDIKFRDSAFRPSKVEFDLDIQMTVYAAALKFGKPSCKACKPKYVQLDTDDENGNPQQQLVYNGPCADCAAKIGTNYWPEKYAERCELIWLRDFEKREKDEYVQYIKDPAKIKVVNPDTGRLIIREIPNPNWLNGYKKGDYKGPGILTTYRSRSQISVLMSDVIRICEEIRAGVFYRKPGDQCNFWCKYKEQCLKGMELDVNEIDMADAKNFGTFDPFDE